MSHPVHLHVYGSPINRYLPWLGFSYYLFSVEVHGMEHMFGPDGMYIFPPHHAGIQRVAGKNRIESIFIGHAELEIGDAPDHITKLLNIYTAASYHPITNNSHYFADRLCRALTGNRIPHCLNRIAAPGPFCKPRAVTMFILTMMVVVATAGLIKNR